MVAWGPGTNTGHGHVWPRPDTAKARCGGPALCPACARDVIRMHETDGKIRLRVVGGPFEGEWWEFDRTRWQVLMVEHTLEPRPIVAGPYEKNPPWPRMELPKRKLHLYQVMENRDTGERVYLWEHCDPATTP
jgi:hypothetical protein